MKKIIVKWRDTSGLDDSWSTQKEFCEQAKEQYENICTTIGFLLEENENYIVIASTMNSDREENRFHDGNMILKSTILNVDSLLP